MYNHQNAMQTFTQPYYYSEQSVSIQWKIYVYMSTIHTWCQYDTTLVRIFSILIKMCWPNLVEACVFFGVRYSLQCPLPSETLIIVIILALQMKMFPVSCVHHFKQLLLTKKTLTFTISNYAWINCFSCSYPEMQLFMQRYFWLTE